MFRVPNRIPNRTKDGGTCRGLDRFQLAQRPSMPTAGMVPGGAMPGAMPGRESKVRPENGEGYMNLDSNL